MGGGGMPPSHHPHHPHHAHHPHSHHHLAAHLSQSQVGLHHAAAAAVAAEHHPSTSAMYLTSQALGSLGFHRQALMETPSSSLHPYHPAHHHHHHINHQQTMQQAQQQQQLSQCLSTAAQHSLVNYMQRHHLLDPISMIETNFSSFIYCPSHLVITDNFIFYCMILTIDFFSVPKLVKIKS